MSKENQIDNMFRQGLAGREVPYAEGAWAGADQLLTRHYRLAFMKKLAMFLIPAAVVAGSIGYFYFTEPSEAILDEVVLEESVFILSTSGESSSNTDLENSASDTSLPTNKPRRGQRQATPTGIASAAENTHQDTEANDVESAQTHHSDRSYSMASIAAQPPGADIHSLASTPSGETSAFENSNDATSAKNKNTSAEALLAPELAAIKSAPNRKGMMGMPRPRLGKLGTWIGHVMDRESEYTQPTISKTSWLLRAHGGALLTQRLKSNGGSGNDLPLGWFAGIDGRWFFQPNVSLGLSATLHQRAALNSSIQLDGEGSSYQSALYSDLALNVHWNAFRRHTLGFGLGLAPLVDVRGDQAIEDAGVDRDGFANLDATGLLHYEWRATSRLDVMATLRIGAFDLTDDVFFGTENVRDHNHQLRFGLSYRLMQR